MTQQTAASRSSGRHASISASAPARALRIGLMLRTIDEIDGCGVFIRSLLSALFELDSTNSYFLLYRQESQRGRFGQRTNLTEIVVPAPSKVLWDQVAVPLAARRLGVQVLFHHKFSIPLWSPCPTVVQQQGDEYWTFPQYYDTIDRLYATTAIPLYCRRATRVLTISRHLALSLERRVGIPAAEMGTLHAAADPRFVPVADPVELERVRAKYGLPKTPFFLMVAKGYANVGTSRDSLYPRKNIHGAISAHRQAVSTSDWFPPLVVAGPGIPERLDADMRRDVERGSLFVPGYVEYADMPALYGLARALIFPSFSESFGIPLLEAMAAGCPVLSSNAGACAEVVGDAAMLIDPSDITGMAAAMTRLARDDATTETLRRRGLARASQFTYAASAQRLLAELSSAARPGATA